MACVRHSLTYVTGLARVDSQGEYGPIAEEDDFMSADVIVDEVRRVRDKLVKRYGGLDGWIEHLQAMDRERAAKALRLTDNKTVGNGRKRRKPSTRARARRAIKVT